MEKYSFKIDNMTDNEIKHVIEDITNKIPKDKKFYVEMDLYECVVKLYVV